MEHEPFSKNQSLSIDLPIYVSKHLFDHTSQNNFHPVKMMDFIYMKLAVVTIQPRSLPAIYKCNFIIKGLGMKIA
jgi:hypothetical protein